MNLLRIRSERSELQWMLLMSMPRSFLKKLRSKPHISRKQKLIMSFELNPFFSGKNRFKSFNIRSKRPNSNRVHMSPTPLAIDSKNSLTKDLLKQKQLNNLKVKLLSLKVPSASLNKDLSLLGVSSID